MSREYTLAAVLTNNMLIISQKLSIPQLNQHFYHILITQVRL